MTDQDVRDMLRRRAADATPSPEAWDRIVERIAADEPAPVIDLAERRRLRRLPPVVLGAIAAAVLVLVGAVVLLEGDDPKGDQRLRAADDGPSTGDRDPARPLTVVAGSLPIWPATNLAGLAPFQADADAGRRPDLRDPRAVAAAYLSERFADPDTPGRLVQAFAVGDVEPSDALTAEVPYESPPGTPAGVVVVRQGQGEHPIWFVTGAATSRLTVTELAYDGSRVTGLATAAARGDLTVRVGPSDGDVATGELTQGVTHAEKVRLDQRISGTPGVVLFLRLTESTGQVSFAELRIDRLVLDSPEAAFESSGKDAVQRWIRAAATGDLDVAWDTLAPQSKDALGSRARLEDRRTELAVGWGAWDGAEDVTVRVVDLMAADGGDIPDEIPHHGVAILSGRVAQEGTTAFRTLSIPLRGPTHAVLVDPFAGAGVGIEIDGEAAPGVRTSSGSTLGAYSPAAARVWFLLDDRAPAPPDLLEGADGDQQHATFIPKPPLAQGQHTFTVVVLTVDGRLASRSTAVTVSGQATEPLECGSVAFTPASEDLASSITATGTTCEEALRFVELAGRQTGAMSGPEEVDVDGYLCVRTAQVDDPLPMSSYRCTKGSVTVTFDRT